MEKMVEVERATDRSDMAAAAFSRRDVSGSRYTTHARFPRREGIVFAAGFGSAAACRASARVRFVTLPPLPIGIGPRSLGPPVTRVPFPGPSGRG